MDRTALATRLKGLRGAMTREALARHLGVSESSVIKYENGDRVPSDPVKKKYAELFGVSVIEVFFYPESH